MSSQLINMGVSILGQRDDASRPIVVVGTARGGTSMIAGALYKLGVFMGDSAIPPVYEDVKLSKAFEQGDFEGVKKIITDYEKYDCWGWKRPSSISYLDKVDEVIESPRYIFIFKDILSIAQRNSISMLADVLPMMQKALEQYLMCLKFLESKCPAAMMVSYEKAVRYPENLIDKLIEYCSLSPSADQISEAVSFVRPNPADYLDASRVTLSQGRIDSVNESQLFGWARYVHIKKPAEVDIYLNDVRIGSVLANEYRKDVSEKIGRDCAFSFDFPKGISLRKNDILRAKVSDDIKNLANSPIIYASQP